MASPTFDEADTSIAANTVVETRTPGFWGTFDAWKNNNCDGTPDYTLTVETGECGTLTQAPINGALSFQNINNSGNLNFQYPWYFFTGPNCPRNTRLSSSVSIFGGGCFRGIGDGATRFLSVALDDFGN